MLNAEDRKWYNVYENLNQTTKYAVDQAFDAATEALRENELTVNNCDPSECFIAAITRLVIESQELEKTKT